MSDNSKSRKSGRNSRRPTNQRYRLSSKLRERKIRNLRRVNRLTRGTAIDVLDHKLACIPPAEVDDGRSHNMSAHEWAEFKRAQLKAFREFPT